ncbi:DNA-methyltransferase [Cyanobacterium sp. IPPAS B-1200]|uniref:DNA-methyltransferase n=1 Tax=Cyanobacterium sp. IPPAS B-1200 TaxID=1562720 RepID=UPI003D59363E
MTSPPYAKRRSKTYGGINPDEYVDWFFPISQELKRVLKPTGSFILNIKEPAINGERHTFVIQLTLALKQDGWRWVDEYCWHKKNSHPGKWNNRFRDSWERCLHFTKEKKFAMYQDAVMIPVGDWKKKRFKNLSQADRERNKSSLGNDFSRNVSNWKERDMVYPSNVLHLATECRNRGHSAAFPIDLPIWFIKLFTQEGDVVLDPFIGGGTTALACQELNRHFIGIELNKDYYDLACSNLGLL